MGPLWWYKVAELLGQVVYIWIGLLALKTSFSATHHHTLSTNSRNCLPNSYCSDSTFAFVLYLVRIVTIASNSLKDDCLKARILLKTLGSIQEMPSPFVLKTACLTISLLVSEFTDSGNWLSMGPKSNEPIYLLLLGNFYLTIFFSMRIFSFAINKSSFDRHPMSGTHFADRP